MPPRSKVDMAKQRIGVWLIGTKGGVATTTIVGLLALQKGLAPTTGLVSLLPQFSKLDLPDWSDLFIGGHEIRKSPLHDEAQRVANDMRAVSISVIEKCRDELDEIDARIRPGTTRGVGSTISSLADLALPADASTQLTIARLQADLREFQNSLQLEHVVVVNVASTEGAFDANSLPKRWADLAPLLRQADSMQSAGPLPASSLYAIAALDLGFSYINFTPSLGAAPAAIAELAQLRGGRHAGCDGKTGETLLKSVLAPMFACRNLQVMSWVSHNIFGNMDGRVLDDPANKKTKLESKDRLLGEILGYKPQTHISIEYIESLGDWKTAWDHIHFSGFLGTPMTFQFIWQGCDSVLAAPLVLDLVRFTEAARRKGQTGLLLFLSSFFKNPLGADEHSFDRQFQILEDWAARSGTIQETFNQKLTHKDGADFDCNGNGRADHRVVAGKTA
jgi:myo-inositol-1-phosphate synthase